MADPGGATQAAPPSPIGLKVIFFQVKKIIAYICASSANFHSFILRIKCSGQWAIDHYPVSIITIRPTSSDSGRNLGAIFNASLTISDHIFSVSKSCFMSIHDLSRIRNTHDSTTTITIAYISNSFQGRLLQLSLSQSFYCSQLDRLQSILNFAARALSKTPRFTHISPVLKFLHWLKIYQHIHDKILSISYKTISQALLCTIFCKFNQTLAFVLIPLSLLNAAQFPLDSK